MNRSREQLIAEALETTVHPYDDTERIPTVIMEPDGTWIVIVHPPAVLETLKRLISLEPPQSLA
ncbi:hypothetical protein [Sulfobacillus thermosulfidooxidans]|uniref:hypothetical protein n=1 Tax=Sulfobacillus thermosulfidooxidans TaxID=28034 RepID=UPI0006B4C500|nr:hypothetical protein [Sulfobacillus thermosulfidooxidans]